MAPREDLSDPDLGIDQPPHMIDDPDYLLDLEMRPLLTAAKVKDHKMLQRIWKRTLAWDACHFYKLIEFYIKTKDNAGLTKFTQSLLNINHFYEPRVLQ